MPVSTEILAVDPSKGWSSWMETEISVSLVLRDTLAERMSEDMIGVESKLWPVRKWQGRRLGAAGLLAPACQGLR